MKKFLLALMLFAVPAFSQNARTTTFTRPSGQQTVLETKFDNATIIFPIATGMTSHQLTYVVQPAVTGLTVTVSTSTGGTYTACGSASTSLGGTVTCSNQTASMMKVVYSGYTGSGAVDATYYGVTSIGGSSSSATGCGTAANTYISYWTDSATLCGDSGFTYNETPTAPTISLVESDQAVNGRWWAQIVNGGVKSDSVCDDTGANCSAYSAATRSGLTVATVAYSAGTGFGFSKTGATPIHFVDIVGGNLSLSQAGLSVTGTLNASNATGIAGIIGTFIGSGSGGAGTTMEGANITISAGYTGSGRTRGISINNASAGTGANGWAAGVGNYGVRSSITGSTVGHNIGVSSSASGSSTLNMSGSFLSTSSTNTPVLNVGVGSLALNATTNVAGFFGLMSSAPTLATTAALIADNGAVAGDIFEARDNGTVKVSIQDGGLLNVSTQILGGNGAANAPMYGDAAGTSGWYFSGGTVILSQTGTNTLSMDYNNLSINRNNAYVKLGNGSPVYLVDANSTNTLWFSTTTAGSDNNVSLGDGTHRIAKAVISNLYDGPAGELTFSATAPTISSGFGSSPSVTSGGSSSFRLNVGTGGAATTGVIGLPTATTGWNCTAQDVTTPDSFVTTQTASTTASASFKNYSRTTGLAIAWTASDVLAITCAAF